MEVPQGKKRGAKSGLRRKQYSKHTIESKTTASKCKIGHSDKENQSSSKKDKSLSHPLDSTPVVGEIHKEAQQAASGPTSLGATTKKGAYPQLISGMSAFSIIEPVYSASFIFTLSLHQDPIIVLNESDEDTHATFYDEYEDTLAPPPPSPKSVKLQELLAQVKLLQSQKDTLEQQKENAEAEVAFLKARPLYPYINQLTKLLVTSLKPKLTKLFASYDFANCLPTELKELPLKITELFRAIKELKKHVQDMEIKLPWDLKEILNKLDTFTSTISSLTSHVAKLKTIQWELPAGFATIMKNASSGATCTSVLSDSKVDASPAEGEKNTNPTTEDVDLTNLKNKLVDLFSIDVVEKYHNKKLLYDKYCDKILKQRKNSKIINCDVLTQKVPITLKIYRFRRGKELQAKKAEALKTNKIEFTNANRSKTPTKRCSKHMNGVKSYLYKYVEQPGPKVVFEDDSTCTSEVYIHNHKDYLGKFDEKVNDGYFLGYSLVSKAFKVFNTRRQQTNKTYHITLDESTDAIKFTKPLIDNINIAESERYPPGEYLYPYEPSQRYQTNSNNVSFMKPYERSEPAVLKTKVSSNQNDHPAQTDDNQSNQLNHNNDDSIIDNLINTKDVQNPKPTSSPAKNTLVLNTIPILTIPLSSIPSMASLVSQDRWYQDKHISWLTS
nr:retrovirus-related Pol polyprotein from transposon TNT 1-94 [Tanacetum cinerariifolium]GEV35278.1 retrovirus-related Pol polyprotein from transposon TNT 1-94 [Tanacetum cinerariifolium]